MFIWNVVYWPAKPFRRPLQKINNKDKPPLLHFMMKGCNDWFVWCKLMLLTVENAD